MNSPSPPDPSESAPILARLADEPRSEDASSVSATSGSESYAGGEAEAVNRGSPFAVDPLPIAPDRPIEVLIDGGPIRYTAMGAVAAAAMVLVFAAVAAWWFPGGGTMIAALGCALSVFGLYSNYRALAAGFLLMHLALFIVSYGRSFS